MTDALTDTLAARLSTVYDHPCEIANLTALTGGASRETWRFTAVVGDRSHELVLRRDPPGGEDTARMAAEAAAIVEAGRAGVPVPAVVDANEDAGGIGPAYLIMTALGGEALPQRLLRAAEFDQIRPALPAELGRILARIHRMDASAIPGLDDADQLDALLALYEPTPPLPALDIAFAWLTENRPPVRPTGVVHGDFRNGNLLVSPTGVEGVLDWELVHAGDPMEDLGWLCSRAWRFGSPEPVGGFGPREELIRGYAEESGITPDAAEIAWWEVFATVRWAIICRIQAARADTEGGDKTLELLSIGRRVAESEFDILEALGWSPTRRMIAAPTPSDDDLFGRPGLGELLAAARDYLTGLGERAGGPDRYQSRVAAHVLSLAERETTIGESARREYRDLLGHTGFSSEQELALAIRSGEADPSAPAIAAAVRGAVELRLAVANPRY